MDPKIDSLTLPAEYASARSARAFVAERTPEGTDAEVALLLTSELVTNVVRHTQSEVRVRVRRGPPFRVEVHDHAAATVAFRELIAGSPVAVGDGSKGGRGLALVHHLAVRVGLDDDADGGKVVWFEL